MLAILINIIINLFIFLFVLRMFISARDAYFNPLFSGIYRATDPVMIPLHKALRRKPVDVSEADYLPLIPVFALIVINGAIMGLLMPGGSVLAGIGAALTGFFDAVFLALLILILTFSVFYKYSHYTSNPIVRTGFKIMQPIYMFIGKYLSPLKKYPGLTVFVLGFIVYYFIVLTVNVIIIFPIMFKMPPMLNLSISVALHCLNNLFFLLKFFMWAIIIGALMSWVSPDPNNPIVQIIRLFSEPINRPFRKIIPTIGGIDISPIFSILALQTASSVGVKLLNMTAVMLGVGLQGGLR